MDAKDQAKKDYLNGMKYRELAEKYQVSINTIKSWKQRHGWDKKGAHKTEKRVHTKQRKGCTQKREKTAPAKRVKSEKQSEQIEPELTEKQIMFCLYYIKNRNATMAAIKAGYSKVGAHVTGSRLLRNAKVREYLTQLRNETKNDLLIDAEDVICEYMKIAYFDPTEYVTFGKKEVQVMGPFGPLYEGKGKDKKPITKVVNFLEFPESGNIDGTLISEVKVGREGASIKFHDKMKALEKLEKYLDLLPDHHKRKIEEEKLKLAQEQLELNKAKGPGGNSGGIANNNEQIITLGSLINNPLPNRNMEDFANDE